MPKDLNLSSNLGLRASQGKAEDQEFLEKCSAQVIMSASSLYDHSLNYKRLCP